MKKWIAGIGFIVGLSILSGCGSQNEGNAVNPGGSEAQEVSLEEIFQQTKAQVAADLKENGVEEPLVDDQLAAFFEIDLLDTSNPNQPFYLEKLGLEQQQLEAGYVIAAMMNVNSDEIILVEAADEAATAEIKAALERELSAQTQTWKQYLPDQFEKVKNNVILQSGTKFIYITYGQPDKIAEIFDSNTK